MGEDKCNGTEFLHGQAAWPKRLIRNSGSISSSDVSTLRSSSAVSIISEPEMENEASRKPAKGRLSKRFDPDQKKRVSKAYTPEQKTAFVELFRQEQTNKGFMLSQRQFAQERKLSHARFSAWCKDYDRLKSLDPSKQKTTRLRKSAARYPVLESRVLQWLDDHRRNNLSAPCTKTVQTQARLFASELGISDFVASSTWLGRFKKRSQSKVETKVSIEHFQSFPIVLSCSDRNRPPSMLTESADLTQWTTDIQDKLVEQILHDFLSRSNDKVTQIELAGIGLSQIDDSLRDFHVEPSEAESQSLDVEEESTHQSQDCYSDGYFGKLRKYWKCKNAMQSGSPQAEE